LNAEQQRRQDLAVAMKTRQSAAEASVAFYQEGETDLEAVLDANRAWADTEEDWVLSELAWATGHVALCKALGGGWEVGE
jgi:outer membrane protein TolC